MAQALTSDVAVIGAGPAGLAAALALGALGSSVVVAAPAYDKARAEADHRTSALLLSSMELLKNLAVWERCSGHAAALEGVRVADDRGGLLRAPEILFKAQELGLPCFGVNIANSALNSALYEVASRASRLDWRPTSAVVRVEPGERAVDIELAEGGLLTAALAVAADGRNSITRAAAGIATQAWSYDQSAVAADFRHSRPHAGITTELHRRGGPLTTVPLPGDRSSLVWVETPPEASRLAALGDQAFRSELAARLQGLLGAVTSVGPRALYPLSGLSAERLAQNRVALVGESAHVIPPIGAQGLNLGLRDAAALAECVSEARARGEDIGGPAMLQAYHAARAADVLGRTVSVDLLNRSLLVDMLPVQALRGLGLHLIANVAPLRRRVMQGGLSPIGRLPRLMRPNALP